MFDERIHYQGGEGQYCCEFERTFKGEYCQERGQVRLEGCWCATGMPGSSDWKRE
jgi:hypothetical protein